MDATRLVPGLVLAVTGLALFFLDAGFGFAGPQLPDTALGYAGWVLVLVGLGLMRLGTHD